MSAGQGTPLPDLTRKWCELAERRRDHFIELYRSGRWRHYYTESEFIARMRDVVQAADRFAAFARRNSGNPQAAA